MHRHFNAYPVANIHYSINFYGISYIVNISSTLVLIVAESPLPPLFRPVLNIAALPRASFGLLIQDELWRLCSDSQTSFGFLMKLLSNETEQGCATDTLVKGTSL
jgi:hypothetical protein